MDKGLGVFQCVVDTLYDIAFAQQYLVPQRHKLVLHVGLYACNKVYAIVEEVIEEPLRDVSPVGEEPAVQILCQHFPHLRVAVVCVGRGEAESDDFGLVVADEVQLEPVAPSHRPFAVGGKTFEDLVHVSPDVVTDGYHSGIQITHAVAPAEGAHFQEEHHDEKHAAFQFHETVVRNRRWEEVLAGAEDIVDVKMLETLVASKVEHQLHGHNLAVGHRGLAAATLHPRSREEVFLKFGVKIFAEFVHNTENLSNFVIGNHKSVFFYYFEIQLQKYKIYYDYLLFF